MQIILNAEQAAERDRLADIAGRPQPLTLTIPVDPQPEGPIPRRFTTGRSHGVTSSISEHWWKWRDFYGNTEDLNAAMLAWWWTENGNEIGWHDACFYGFPSLPCPVELRAEEERPDMTGQWDRAIGPARLLSAVVVQKWFDDRRAGYAGECPLPEQKFAIQYEVGP